MNSIDRLPQALADRYRIERELGQGGWLRQEGRLAALAGDTAGARRAYDQYLNIRTNPDPPFQPQRDSVITERAALGSQ